VARPRVGHGRPTRGAREALGTLTLASSALERYGPADVALVEEVARRIAAAVDSGQRYREARRAEAGYRALFWNGLQNLLPAVAAGAPDAAGVPR